MKTQHALSGSQFLAELLVRDIERIAERSVARMQQLLPAYARVPRHEVTPVVVANTRNVLLAIRDPDGDHLVALDGYRRSGDTRARQGITSDEMLHAWRIGLEIVREEAYAVAEEQRISKDALLDFVEASLRWGDVGMRLSASRHHEAEIRELGRLVAEQAALRRVATLVAQGVPSEELFDAVCEEVGTLFGADLAGMSHYEDDDTITNFPPWSASGARPDVAGRVSLESAALARKILETGGPARQDRIDEATGQSADVVRDGLGIRSAVGSPIAIEGRAWGVLFVASTNAVRMPADTESRLESFTELVATAIANADARGQVERLAEEQAALRRVATTVARERPAHEVFATVAREVGLLLGVGTTAICRYEPDGDSTVVGLWGAPGDLRLTGQMSWSATFGGASRFEPDVDGVIASVRRTGGPVRIDVDDLPACAFAAVAAERHVRSAVGSPITVNGRLWGAIAAGARGPERMAADTESRMAQFTELVATAISNVQARSDLAASRARIVDAADEERRRVVRDLHDGAQQRLVHTIVTLKLLRRALERDGEDAAALVDEALEQAQTATGELRELAHGILPAVLTGGGLRAAVRALARRMSIPVEVDVSEERLPQAVEATAYFIVAEALTNVSKHSHADRATVRARVERHALELEVRDNGVGGAEADGDGLVGLSDRLGVLGGALRVASPPGGGTLIAAVIPVR